MTDDDSTLVHGDPGTTLDPEVLLLRTAQGDEHAFELFFFGAAAAVLGVARRVLRDTEEAHEVAQEVMVEVWRTAPNYDPARGSAMTWVLKMAHRRAEDRVRSTQAAAAKSRSEAFRLLEESSLGSAGAKALRRRTPRVVAERVRAAARALERETAARHAASRRPSADAAALQDRVVDTTTPARWQAQQGRTKPAADGSIYEEGGGAGDVKVAVDGFYRRVLADPQLAPHLEGIDMPALRRLQVALLTVATGGPQPYQGNGLIDAFTGLGLTFEHLDLMVTHLVDALAELGVPPTTTMQIGERLTPLRRRIMSSGTDERDQPPARSAQVDEAVAGFVTRAYASVA